MECITEKLNTTLREDLWNELDAMEINGKSYKNYIYDIEEKYVEPVEQFIYAIPYGASYIDVKNTFV